MGRVLIEASCEFCGESFRCRKSLPKNLGRFCSRKCFGAWYRISRKKSLICIICGKSFTVGKSYYDRHTCSRECLSIHLSNVFSSTEQIEIRSKTGKSNSGCQHPHRRVNPVIRACIVCGRNFELNSHVGKQQKEKQRFCSTECWYKYIREDGSRHPSWKGGYEPYYGSNWNSQRRKARKRDRYICQKCDVTEYELRHELDVHHIVPFRIFGIDQFKKANQLSNLISLCKSCHSKESKS